MLRNVNALKYIIIAEVMLLFATSTLAYAQSGDAVRMGEKLIDRSPSLGFSALIFAIFLVFQFFHNRAVQERVDNIIDAHRNERDAHSDRVEAMMNLIGEQEKRHNLERVTQDETWATRLEKINDVNGKHHDGSNQALNHMTQTLEQLVSKIDSLTREVNNINVKSH